MFSRRIGLAAAAGVMLMGGATVVAQNGAGGDATTGMDDMWGVYEAGLLRKQVQLTTREDFIRAGEAYFSPDGEWIIFQAIPTPAQGNEPREHYSMFVAKVTRDDDGDVSGLKSWTMISHPHAATTCGFFHPTDKGRVIYGSTLKAPEEKAKSGYQRGTSKYRWAFPEEMEVVTRIVPTVYLSGNPHVTSDLIVQPKDAKARPLFDRPGGYDAECAYSPDARHVIFASVDPETGDADLFVHDLKVDETRPLITADGYDGGPFFSPDGAMICYRSDREGNDLLQIFVAELDIDDTGAIVGVKEERQVTDNEHVNWAPYWHPSGDFLVYATSEVGHHNYEVFSVEVPRGDSADKGPADLRRRRITHAEGFDGLPVFSPDGDTMMWTSQRGPKIAGEDRPSSQIWVADVVDVRP